MSCKKPINLTHLATAERPHGISVPCGRCLWCRVKKAHEWAIRLLHESDNYEDCLFVTLTYDDDHLPKDQSLKKGHLRNFFKRLRVLTHRSRPQSVFNLPTVGYNLKHFSAGEYGGLNGRPHYHSIIFGLSFKEHKVKGKDNVVLSGLLYDAWKEKGIPIGRISIGSVTYDSIRYVTSYVFSKYSGELGRKVYGSKGLSVPFQLSSNKLGFDFVMRNKEVLKQNLHIRNRGRIVSMPRYYKDKLFNSFNDMDEVNEAKRILEARGEEIRDKQDKEWFLKGISQKEFWKYAKKRAEQAERNLLARQYLRDAKI